MTTPDKSRSATPSLAKRILLRFSHVFSAQFTEAVLSILFFVCVAWVNRALYGEIMYSIAVGVIVLRVVQFGLYYWLVGNLAGVSREESAGILVRVNAIKAALMAPSMIFVLALAWFRSFSSEQAWILLLVCAGHVLEALADTLFADFRVRGEQYREACIKIVGSVAGFGYGICAALMGLHPILVGLYKLVCSLVRILFAAKAYFADYGRMTNILPDPRSLWPVVRLAAVFAIIDILTNICNKSNILFLEWSTGAQGVAFYSATWIIVDSVSWFTVEQLLGWVVFPVLATLWVQKNPRFTLIIRSGAQWLIAVAFPIMFFLFVESDLIISLVYPNEYRDAAWMQRYLVWTIILSFVQYLFAYVMMVVGAQRLLLLFAVVATALNMLLNFTLVGTTGLLGGCLTIIFTKLSLAVMTSVYCQVRFRIFRLPDLLYPLWPAAACLCWFFGMEAIVTLRPAVASTLILYCVIIWKIGPRLMGRMPAGGNVSRSG